MADREGSLRFLDLPAELRNRVYEYASAKPDNDKSWVLPHLSLTHVCRQLRAEYLPICMRAPAVIAWRDADNYLHTFYPTVNGQIQNIENAPMSLFILVSPFSRNDRIFEVDILTLWKIRRVHPDFTCKFVHSQEALAEISEDGETMIDEELQIYLQADGAMLGAFLQHAHEQWVCDIESETVIKVMCSVPGTDSDPIARFFIDSGEETYLMEDSGVGWESTDEERVFFARVGLEGMWTTKINGDEYQMIAMARRMRS